MQSFASTCNRVAGSRFNMSGNRNGHIQYVLVGRMLGYQPEMWLVTLTIYVVGRGAPARSDTRARGMACAIAHCISQVATPRTTACIGYS